MRLTLPLLVGALLIPACSKAEPTKPSADVSEPDDPQRDAARAAPAGKVRIELVRSQPADKGDKAEYEWAIVTRLPPAAKEEAKPDPANPEPGWMVFRLTVRAERIDPPSKKDGRKVARLSFDGRSVIYSPGQMSGRGSSGGTIGPGTLFLFDRLTRHFAPLAAGREEEKDLDAPDSLDSLLKPLLKGPETVDLPATVKLFQYGERVSNLEITR